MDTPELTGHVALVTGGANGLGRATVRELRARGARVGVLDLVPAAVFDGDDGVVAVVGDVAGAGVAAAALAAVADAFGPVDILVNDAADYPNATVLEMDLEAWRHVFDVNVHGLFQAVQAFGRQYLDRGLATGRVVSISTGSARSPRPAGAAYAASKSAVETISAVLAMELGPLGITSNVVAPGYIDVRGHSDAHPDRAPEHLRAALVSQIPAGRAGLPEDIAAAVAFCCSPAAAHLNGAVLAVDGGSSAGRFTLPPGAALPPVPAAVSG